jgi:protein gp37
MLEATIKPEGCAMAQWNPWHGCIRISPGCLNCYVYRGDERYGRDSGIVAKTKSFDLPLRKNRKGEPKISSGETVYTCFTSDFFLDEADSWRADAWAMIKMRSDLDFLIITKRIHRFHVELPYDWGGGYPNVTIFSTVENQAMADFRLPILLDAPIKHKGITAEPLLERIDLSRYLGPQIEAVVAGGESGPNARVCDYNWILDIRRQCIDAGVPFTFKQTGHYFRKDGKLYTIKRKYQHTQARRAGINIS